MHTAADSIKSSSVHSAHVFLLLLLPKETEHDTECGWNFMRPSLLFRVLPPSSHSWTNLPPPSPDTQNNCLKNSGSVQNFKFDLQRRGKDEGDEKRRHGALKGRTVLAGEESDLCVVAEFNTILQIFVFSKGIWRFEFRPMVIRHGNNTLIESRGMFYQSQSMTFN